MLFRSVEADKYSEEGKAMMASAFRDYCEEGGFPEVVRAKSRSEKELACSYWLSECIG